MDNLAVAGLLVLTLGVNVVWRWVGPGTPIRRSLLIAPPCAAAGVGAFLALRGLGATFPAYLAAVCCGLTALLVLLVPLVGRRTGAGAPSVPGTGA